MLFNSPEFIFLFLPITLIFFYGIARFQAFKSASIFLLIASIYFYGYWKTEYIFLLIISVLVNYFLGSIIIRCQPSSTKAKTLMWLGIIFDLGILGFFKYFGFLVENINGIFSLNLQVPQIILPLAISFYSFTQIAYLVDAYKGEEHISSLTNYSLFITFFPQLIAGPILRHNQLIPELESKKMFSFSNQSFSVGLMFFILGLSKKVIIADSLSPWVAGIFDNAQSISMIEAWFGAFAYTLQLYFDFSGYSDMAVGLGKMFNVNIPINFNSPYKASSIADFWRRWHITLSNFLRDYLYIPLGGNRKGKLRQYINLMLTMLLGGLWHGAGWTFIIWGGMHGSYLIIHRVFSNLSINVSVWIAQSITFIAVVFSWVIFRVTSLADASSYINAMINPRALVLPGRLEPILGWTSFIGSTFKGSGISTALPNLPGNTGLLNCINLVSLSILLLIVFTTRNTNELAESFRPDLKWTIILGILFSWIVLSFGKGSEFLYFQF